MKVQFKEAQEMINLITPRLKELKKEFALDEKEM